MTNRSQKHLSLLFTLVILALTACLPVNPNSIPLRTESQTSQSTTPAAAATFEPTSTSTQIPAPSPNPTLPDTPAASATPAARVQRVLIISFDGLRPDAIDLAPMPTLQALMKIGAYSLTARTIFPSVTLPSHTSMLDGLCPAKHGVDWNDYLPAKGFAHGTNLMDLAHAAGLKTVMFVGKEKLVQVGNPANVDLFRYINDRDTVIAQRFTEELPLDFGVMFLHFPTIDGMGHAYGWMSPQYMSVARRADQALAMVLKDLEDHSLRDGTLIFLTADHGGHLQSHGTKKTEDMLIPWVVVGPGVHPGILKTPVETTDTAATAAWALGLPIPHDWDGVPVYEIFGETGKPRLNPYCE